MRARILRIGIFQSEKHALRNRSSRFVRALVVCTLFAAVLILTAQKRAQITSPLVYVFGAASFQVSNGGQVVAEGDFNEDGRPDLAAVTSQNNAVSILLGQQDGSLLDSGATYPVGVRPQAIAVADFNGDGKPDLAVLNFVCPPNTNSCPAGSVSILLGNGDGTFQSHVDYATGPAPVAIVAGDFNGDGKLDLAVTNHVDPINSASPGTMSILLGNGDGTFQSHVDSSAGSGVGNLAAADFNNDGKLDLVIANTPSANNSAVLLMLGNGNGTFQPPTNLTLGGAPVAFATGDFNRDGNTDLAVSTSTNLVSVLLGNGNGTFQAHADYPVALFPGRIIAADLNKDGNLDLIVGAAGNFQEGFASLLLGNADGTFQPHADYIVGSSALVAVADFNGDGNKDVAVAQGNLAQIVLGNGDGSLPQPIQYDVGGSPSAVAVADFNNDGKPDLAVANCPGQCQNSTVSIFLGTGDGTFQSRKDSPAGGFVFFIATGDFNGDGKQDIAVSNSQDAEITVLLGNGDGTFKAGVTYSVGHAPAGIVAGDFNGDGVLDLAAANQFDNTVSILMGNGDGTFKAQTTYQTGPGPVGLAEGDFNGDGKLDLAVADSGTPVQGPALVSVLLGNGDGTFQNHLDTAMASLTAANLTTGDFNSDGKLDLAVATNVDTNFGRAVILLGNGDGTFLFSNNNVYGTGLITNGIAAGDFNGDGALDLDVPSLETNNLILLKGKGNGSMQYQGIYGAGVQPYAVAMADLNADNIADVVAANLASNTISVLVSHAASGPGFSVSLAPPSQTIQSGASASYNVNVTPIGGFNGTVSLSCSGNPNHSSCSISPSSLTLDGSSAATATLSVTSGSSASVAGIVDDRTLPLFSMVFWIGLTGTLAFVGIASSIPRASRRVLVPCLTIVLLLVLLGPLPSCGGAGQGPSPGTYTLSVDGVSGSIQRSATATLVVR